MSETSSAAGSNQDLTGAGPRSPGLDKLFQAAAAREARSSGVSAKPAAHPHAWLEADQAPRRKEATDQRQEETPRRKPLPDIDEDAPTLGAAFQGRGPMNAAVVITLAALVAAAAVWLLVFGG